MYRAGNSGTDIDWSCPVNWQHPHNFGLLAWYLFVPGAIGGPTWINMADVGRYKMGLSSSIVKQAAWRDTPVRNGGWGGLKLLTAASDHCDTSTPAVTAEPLSMSGWFRLTGVDVDQSIVTVNGLNARHTLGFLNAGDVVCATSVTSVGGASSATSAGVLANVWSHGCAVFAGAADRRAYHNGGGKGTETTSRAVSGMTRTSLGVHFFGGTGTAHLNGHIDSVKIWNRVLSDADVVCDFEEGKHGYPSLLNRVNRRRSRNAAVAAGGFRSRIAGGLVVTAS